MRSILTAFVLAALWLLMSGLFKTLLLILGALSVIGVVLIIRRMDSQDGDQLVLRLKPIAFIGYVLWLLVEIAKANWAVTKVILSPQMKMRQHLFHTRFTQKTDLGQVIFANSITLTPGTITVECEDQAFLVHALNYSADDNLALADMDARVSAAEWAKP